MNKLAQKRIEMLRGELFHMIFFAIAWVLIGEYSLDFKDYASAGILVLIMVVWFAIYSIRLYEFEDSLQDDNKINVFAIDDAKERKRGWLFGLIFIFEGIAFLVTWVLLLKWHKEYWLIPCFALIAGLHFFPLGKLMHHNAYYVLGVWICMIAVLGYLQLYHLHHDRDTFDTINTLIAYGCSAGAIVDGIGVMLRAQRLKSLHSGGNL